LAGHLAGLTPRQIFAEKIKHSYAAANGLDASDIMTVSFVPCLAQKYGSKINDLALTAGELARMIKLAGIDIVALPEESFDSFLESDARKTPVFQKETVRGFAQAHKLMEDIRKDRCKVQWVEILSC
jgi:iron only hydrogenase large subunit-like protein